MPIEKILVEYAKLHLQIVSAQEEITRLQAEIAALKSVPPVPQN